METIKINKEILKKWCFDNLQECTDWTGTRVETQNHCESVLEFIDKLYKYLEEKQL